MKKLIAALCALTLFSGSLYSCDLLAKDSEDPKDSNESAPVSESAELKTEPEDTACGAPNRLTHSSIG